MKGLGVLAIAFLMQTQLFAMCDKCESAEKPCNTCASQEKASCEKCKTAGKTCETCKAKMEASATEESMEMSTDSASKELAPKCASCKAEGAPCTKCKVKMLGMKSEKMSGKKACCAKKVVKCKKMKKMHKKSYIKMRNRVEFVDGTSSGSAATTRFVLGGSHYIKDVGVKLVAEAMNVVLSVNDSDGNSLIADTESSRFTKLYVQKSFGDVNVIFGDRPINLGNQRFVGSVNWRQMPQTFGALSAETDINENAHVYGAVLFKRNGVTQATTKEYNTGSLLLNGTYKVSDSLNLEAYGYLIEDTHNTLGIKGKGSVSIGMENPVSYEVEVAVQADPSITTDAYSGDVSTKYYRVEAESKLKSVSFGLGFESFGDKDSGTTGFSTPLATLHKFNGWSDVMASRAATGDANGFSDLFVSVGLNDVIGMPSLSYHVFNSVTNDIEYGSEIDFSVSKKVSDRLTLSAKAAIFSAGDASPLSDTNKFWIMASSSF